MKSSLKAVILALSLVGWTGSHWSAQAQNGIVREVYTNVTTLTALANSPAFPNGPSVVGSQDEFEAPEGFGDRYGQRLRGFLIPPQTGKYIFWIAADQEAVLSLSSDDNPGNKVTIAQVTAATNPRQWDNPNQVNQKSIPITLQQGRLYYVEALMAENTGADHVAVRWQLPDGTIEEPIPGERIYGELIPAQVATPPANAKTTEGTSASFTVRVRNIVPVLYQWQRNGVDIPGATNATLVLPAVVFGDNGARFRVAVTNLFGGDLSSEATLTIDRDTVIPSIVSVLNQGDNDVVAVSFSKAVDPVSATNLANYSIDGLTILSATLGPDGKTVILRTSPMTFGTTYFVVINNVTDRADQPNAIDPDSLKDFAYYFTPLDPSLVYGGTEKLGPSTRRTGLTFSEIMYHPAPRTDGRNLEFIEIYNSQAIVENLGGFKLRGTVDYTFPPGTFIPPGGFLVVAPEPTDVQTIYGLPKVFGGFTDRIPNDRGTIRLEDDIGAVLLETSYDSLPPWPTAPDGSGHSLILLRPSYGEGDPSAWGASEQMGGSPGRAEPNLPNPYRPVVINEIYAQAADADYIELFNYSTRPVDLSECYLSNDATTNKFRIPANTILPALGIIAFDESQLGFSLDAGGGAVYFVNPQRTRVIEATRYPGQAVGQPMGRYPNGAARWQTLSSKTPGASNAKPLRQDVVINEIMYHPISENDDDEYIELYNRGPATVDLSGWAFDRGIDFVFPQGSKIPAKGYVVVARNAARLISKYSQLNQENTFGNYRGALANSGEIVRLMRPETLPASAGAKPAVIVVVADSVHYEDGGRWGKWSDGGGSSLELVDPEGDNDVAAHWADSDESAKGEWTTIEATGVLDNGNTNFPAANLHALMEGAGEVLLDNVEVYIGNSRTNLVANGKFESGANGWVAQGTHEDTSISTNGFQSNRSLWIRSAGRGDTAANRIRTKLSTTIPNGATATLRAKARWVRGENELLLRLHGNYLEVAATLPVPANLGTPGLPNSRRIANAGPAISRAVPSPVLPTPNQDCTISAEVSDNTRVASVALFYRLDPATNFTRVDMAFSGAGFYSGVIPRQLAGRVAAYYLQATDVDGATSVFPSDAPNRECLVLFGDSQPSSAFGTYHLWLSQRTVNRWATREQASNKDLDATFVYNNERVVYNMGAQYSGSPFHWRGYNGPLGAACNYLLHFSGDELFLGDTDFVLNLPSNAGGTGGNGTDQTALREQTFYWLVKQVGNPYTYRRYAFVYVNGVKRANIFEDAQQPNGDYVHEWFADDAEGELFKIEDWFEFTDSFTFSNVDAVLRNYTTTGGQKKLARYRWNFRKRAVHNSNHEYANLFALADALNETDPERYVARVESLIDVDEWLGQQALRHLAGDWDSYGYQRGKNMYAYKPENGKWRLLHWDIAFSFGLGNGVTTDLFSAVQSAGIDTVSERMYTTPAFRRSYLRTLQEAATGPMTAARIGSIIDARYNALVANGVPAASAQSVKTWIEQRRLFILSQLSGVASSLAVTINNGNSFSTNRNQVLLTGTAPVEVKTIKINGISYPLTWTSVNNWTLRYALQSSTNNLSIEGYGQDGNLINQASTAIKIIYTGPAEKAEDKIVFNEIMYHPAQPDADFIELHNISRTVAFDLSLCRINGIGFTFKEGVVVAPGSFVVIAKDAQAFAIAYGGQIPIAGEFSASLDRGGETLTLTRPDVTGTNEIILDSVKYDDVLPWPAGADGAGLSIQLIDPSRDSSRVSNWASGRATPSATNAVVALLSAYPLLWLNEVQAGNLTGPADSKGNRGPWVELYNSGSTSIDLAGYSLTDSFTNLTRWQFPAGSRINAREFKLVWLDSAVANSTTNELHTDFRISAGAGSIALVGIQGGKSAVLDYLSYENLPDGQSFGAFPDGQAVRRETFQNITPGAPNNNTATVANVYINEWLAANGSVISDPADNRFDDWFEIYNPGAQAADLSGYYLTDKATNSIKFQIPNGAVVPANGFLLVWADEETGQNSAGQVHVNFKLSQTGESIFLYTPAGALIDSVVFGAQTNNLSQGRSPDGGATYAFFSTPTPGASNSGVDPNAIRVTARAESGNVALQWNSTSGAAYEIQFKNALNDPSWTKLRDVTASGTTASGSDVIGADQRFYRVLKR